MNLVDKIKSLELENLCYTWVDDVLDREFTETDDLPQSYDEFLQSLDPSLNDILERILNNLNFVIAQNFCEENITWTMLMNHIRRDELLALLFYLVRRGDKEILMDGYAECAIRSARIYLRLLIVPGSSVYNIFHLQFYLACLKCLLFGKKIIDNEENIRADSICYLLKGLYRELKMLLDDLFLVIRDEAFDLLSRDKECIEDTLTALVDLVGYSKMHQRNFSGRDLDDSQKLSRINYECINALISGADTSSQACILNKIFCITILPKLLQATSDKKNKLVCNTYITYSIKLFREFMDIGLEAYKILIQYLCYSKEGLERGVIRDARAQLIVDLLWPLSKKEFKWMVNWIEELSRTHNGLHRNMSLEVISQIVNKIYMRDSQNHIQRRNSQLWENEINEEVNLVNQSSNDNLLETQRQLEEDGVHYDDSTDATSLSSFDGDSSNADQDKSHSLNIKKIISCVLERATDVNGPVRVKALCLLTKFVNSLNPSIIQEIKNLQHQENYGCLINLSTKKVKDEKCGVRKVAIMLMEALFRKDTSLVRHRNLKVIVNACRDCTLTVRVAALSCISYLMKNLPNIITIDAFLAGPMHRESDPEIKVQTAVFDYINGIIFSSFKPYLEETLMTEPPVLPWLFLTMVIKKNMRRHLFKACAALSKKSNCITLRLVDILRSHLGRTPDKDLCCWLMISCIAPIIDVPDVTFAVEYYYGLMQPEPVGSIQAKSLVLEVLTMWCVTISKESRVELRNLLISELLSAAESGLIVGDSNGVVRRSTAALVVKLNPEDNTWACDILSMCEQHAEAGAPLEQWLVAGDVSLIAPRAPSASLINTLTRIVTSLDRFQNMDERTRQIEGWRLSSAAAALCRISLRANETAYQASAPLARLATANQTIPVPARINALLALADLSTKYSTIVEPLLNSMGTCLQDHSSTRGLLVENSVCEAGVLSDENESSSSVRGVAARALTRLLLGGFLKLGRNLYFKYFALLAEDDPEIKDPVEYYISGSVDSDTIINHFLEAVIIYNGCKMCDINHDFASEEFRALENFNSLQGAEKREARLRIYGVMLTHLTYKERLEVQSRLAKGLLAKVAIFRSNVAPNPELSAAISDALTILRLPIMLPPRKQTDDIADVSDLPARALTKMCQEMRKKTVQVMVSTMIALYKYLVSFGSSLIHDVVEYVKELSLDYKQEIDYLLSADSELLSELSILKTPTSALVGGDTPYLSRNRRVISQSCISPDALNISPESMTYSLSNVSASTPVVASAAPSPAATPTSSKLKRARKRKISNILFQ